jgi:hypothetical protein
MQGGSLAERKKTETRNGRAGSVRDRMVREQENRISDLIVFLSGLVQHLLGIILN